MDAAAPVRLHDFDESLPLTPAGPRLWDSRIDKRYWNMIGPWGGWTAALLLKAVLAESDHGGTPVGLTVNLMGGLDESPLQLSTRPARQGKSVEFWTSELTQNGAPVAMAMVTLGQRRETFSTQEATFPEGVKAPEDIAGVPSRPGFFTAMFEQRPVHGSAPLQENPDSLTRNWMRDHQARPLDYVLLAGLADVFAPRIFYRSAERRPASTVSMSVYFHATPAELEAVGGDFILGEVKARRFESGFFDQVGALWSRDGVLLATTDQLCWFK